MLNFFGGGLTLYYLNIKIRKMKENVIFNKVGILFKKKFLKKIQQNIIKSIIREYFNKICYPYLEKENFDIENFFIHKKIIDFRTKYPEKFGKIYDDLRLNARLRSIFHDKLFIDLFSKTLGINKNRLFLNGLMFRFDMPRDKRNSLDWHQDAPYYQQTYPKFNSGVCWLPVTKNTHENGTLIYVPRSNKKFIKNISTIKKNKLSSTLLKVPVTKKESLNGLDANSNFGDAFLMHMNTKHRSGVNISDKI